jgi:hypothetical protein
MRLARSRNLLSHYFSTFNFHAILLLRVAKSEALDY